MHLNNYKLGSLNKVVLATTVSALLIISALVAINVLQKPSVALAQTGDISGNGGALYCRNGARDYGNFLSAVISYDGFAEYWKDIIERYNSNMCVYFDIDALLNRINKTRELVRKAFYTCDASAQKSAQTYHDLEAELFYLRKFVSFSGNGLISFKSNEEMHKLFMDYVVLEKNWLLQPEAKKLFTRIAKKYKARREAYEKCADPTWTNLKLKWEEFVETAGGLSEIKNSAVTLDAAADDLTRTPAGRTGNVLGGLLEMKINGLPPEESLGDILRELQRNTPQGVTFDEAQTAAAVEKDRYSFAVERTTFLAQYQQQYQDGSGAILKELVGRLNDLQRIIQNTFPLIKQTTQCTKGLLDKTCG